jgi:hypothetical protein
MAIFPQNILFGWMNPVLMTIRTNAHVDGQRVAVLVFVGLPSYEGNDTQFSQLLHLKVILLSTSSRAL